MIREAPDGSLVGRVPPHFQKHENDGDYLIATSGISWNCITAMGEAVQFLHNSSGCHRARRAGVSRSSPESPEFSGASVSLLSRSGDTPDAAYLQRLPVPSAVRPCGIVADMAGNLS